MQKREETPDQMAKRNGFQSYQQMRDFMARRSESLRDSNTTANPKPTASPTPPPSGRKPGEGLWGYISRKMSGN